MLLYLITYAETAKIGVTGEQWERGWYVPTHGVDIHVITEGRKMGVIYLYL